MIHANNKCPSVQVSTTWLAITTKAATMADEQHGGGTTSAIESACDLLAECLGCLLVRGATPGCWSGIFDVDKAVHVVLPFNHLQATLLCAT
jgi:hypothetical protein